MDYGIFNTIMQTITSTIDAAGRIVIPRAMREALDLTKRGEVKLVLSDGQISIQPAPCEYKIVKRGAFAVAEPVTSVAESDRLSTADIEAIRDTLRTERISGAAPGRRKA